MVPTLSESTRPDKADGQSLQVPPDSGAPSMRLLLDVIDIRPPKAMRHILSKFSSDDKFTPGRASSSCQQDRPYRIELSA